MPVKFTGQIEKTPRLVTPFHSFNRAYLNRAGEVGLPIRNMAMFSGNPGVGKSTLVYTLAAKAGNQASTGIVLADTENRVDENYITTILWNAKYDGFLHNAEGEGDTEKIESMLEYIRKGTHRIGIIDSVGSISPVAEVKGGIEDANMGRRARVMAVVSRQFTYISRNSKGMSVLFLVNHLHPNIGGYGQNTSGGVTAEYLSSTTTRLTVGEKFEDGSKVIKGKVTKNSYGFDQREFFVFNLAGWGIHPGLTAVYDCMRAGLAKIERTVRLGDQKFGYLKDMIKNYDDDERFQPFMDALKGQANDDSEENTVSAEDTTEEE